MSDFSLRTHSGAGARYGDEGLYQWNYDSEVEELRGST